MSGWNASSTADAPESTPTPNWLTAVALLLLLSLVMARAMMLETNHDASATLREAGPTSALILDLLCGLIAMVPLVRRLLDPNYRLQLTWSHAAMGLIAVWMGLSILWAANRFNAVMDASHFIAGLCILFAASQFVRQWLNVRRVTALLIGLLAAQICAGAMYRFSEWPETLTYFQQNKAQVLADHGWEPNGFAARQFEHKLRIGEVMGFTRSPNSYAAMLVLGAIVAMGWIIQRWRQRQGQDWAIIGMVAIALLAGLWMITYTDSKTAYVTPALAVIALIGLGLFGRRLVAHTKGAFWIGVGLFLLGTAALIGHGLAHGSLVIDSLTFRWRYWVASWALFEHHPWLGVGWGNFAWPYLQFRLPIASEEIKSPHNFLMRFLTELGMIGAALVIAWMGRLWWELTRPALPPLEEEIPAAAPSNTGRAHLLGWMFAVAAGAFVINVLVAIDWRQASAYIISELLKRGIFFAVFFILATVAAVRSLEEARFDTRPAPWMLIGLILAAGVFLLHNLIDFSMDETGPMMLFMLTAGTALGARQAGREASGRIRAARWIAGGAWIAATAVWVSVVVKVLLPVASAEQLAADAQTAAAARDLNRAGDLMSQAAHRLPSNGDYAFNASQFLLQADRPTADVIRLMNEAIRADPLNADYHLRRAELEMRLSPPDEIAAMQDFQQAIRLNPNNMSNRLQFARWLEQMHHPSEAKAQYEAVLRLNDALETGDPRRLTPLRVDEIRRDKLQ